MVAILRNSAIVLVVTVLLSANIYWQTLNPYVACFGALVAGWISGLLVERFLIGRAHGEMRRAYGKDWA